MKNLLKVLTLVFILVASGGFAQDSTIDTTNQSISKNKIVSSVSENAETILEDQVIELDTNADYGKLISNTEKTSVVSKEDDTEFEYEYEYEYEFQTPKSNLNNVTESTDTEYEYEYEYETATVEVHSIFDNSEVEYELYTPNNNNNISDGVEVEYVYE